MLNIRPSISSIVDYVVDPNPTLANPWWLRVSLVVPSPFRARSRSRTRLKWSPVIRVDNGNIAGVMGGLIEDRVENVDNTVPGVSHLPILVNFSKQRRDQAIKTELVIFLRPIIIRDASLQGDFGNLKELLPKHDFFKEPPGLGKYGTTIERGTP